MDPMSTFSQENISCSSSESTPTHSHIVPDFTTNFTGAGNTVDPPMCSIWKCVIEGVGQKFPTSAELRIKLEKYAMAHKFNYNFEKNDGSYVKVKCAIVGCPWMLRASKVGKTKEFHIYKFEAKHLHVAGDDFISKFRASKKLVANIIEEKIRGTPSYAPKEIVKDFMTDYHVKIPYKQAWHGKELTSENLHGSSLDSYRRLPWLLEKIKEANPGSVAFLRLKENRFHQCFISFKASVNGFLRGCRPLLFIDGTFLKCKFRGTLLSAQACDADNGMYPVAFAIVSGETFNDWSWFLKSLKDSLNTDREIIIVSDRNANIIRSVREVFGHDLHAFCFRHLEQNVLDHARGKYLTSVLKKTLKDALWMAACARLPPDYMEVMEKIKDISPEAHTYLENNSPEHWAVSKFPRLRYDQMTSNMAESFNNWILEARELPIYSLIDNIRINMMKLISKRQTEKWKTVVGPRIDDKMKIRLTRASGLIFYQSSAIEYEVRGGEISHRVNLQERSCTCRDWLHSGLPCLHACTVIKGLDMDPYAFVHDYYKRDTQDQIYAYSIRPIDTCDRKSKVDDVPQHNLSLIQPPLTRKQSGRPKKRRIESQELHRRTVHCSRCKQKGHYRSTCNHGI